MIFPKLNVLNENWKVDSGYENTFFLCHLDWSSFDEWKIEIHKHKILMRLDRKLTPEEMEAFETIMTSSNWKEWTYPTQFESVYKKFEQFAVPKSYYQEIIYFQEMALNEYNRSRPFDTNVRDHLLEVAEAAVRQYFYLIWDAIWMFNKELYETKQGGFILDNQDYFCSIQQINLIESLWLFRFWKHQTGGGLVVERSLKNLHQKNEVHKAVRGYLGPILEQNMDSEIFELYNLDMEKILLEKIKAEVRNIKLDKLEV